MSRILDFVKNMQARFGRDRVLEDLDMSKASLEQNAIPSWQNMAEYMNGQKITSTQAKGFERLARIHFKEMNSNMNVFDAVAARLALLPAIAATVTKIINKDFERDMLAEGLTVDKVYVIRLTAVLSYIDTTALQLLNYLTVAEAGKDPVKELSRAAAKEAEDAMEEFVGKLEGLTRLKPTELESFIKQLPDVVVSETAEQALAALGDARLDPTNLFRQQPHGFLYSPIHWGAMLIAQRQAERYKRNTELRKILAMRLLDMKVRNSDSPDPVLENQIRQTQSRIDVLDAKIRTFEEKTL